MFSRLYWPIWAATILFTLVTLVRINKRVEKWTQEKYEKNWREDRKRWDNLHRLRVCALLLALICLVMEIRG